ncbi:hypothetical protein D9611_007247 [Ephemerocybe angulata]|uniref:Transcriptional repressor Tup1 N-terminal domain-containing protein n=1 Tax=Ephemerocybe angulata TaxID=980116 RepID=A0A8H5B0X5_9AGAR|nr:hypothetical protein D9611_007247 [Tulosesus angulatus]
MSASSIYNHRSLQPTGRSTTAQAAPPPIPPRLSEAFDAIKQEFDAIATEVDLYKGQKDDVEHKLNAQISELNSIRRTVYELESQQAKIRAKYEEEVASLHAQIASLRHATHPSGPLGIHSLPSNSGGGSGVNPGANASSSLDSISNGGSGGVPPYGDHPSNGRSRDLPMDARAKELQDPRGREGGIRGGEPPQRLPPREFAELEQQLAQRERELDRITDQRDPKRLKKRDPSGEQSFSSTPRLPSSHALYPPSGPGGQLGTPYPPPPSDPAGRGGGSGAPSSSFPMPALPPGPSTSSSSSNAQKPPPSSDALVPPPPSSAGEEFTFTNVPPEYRREGSDWFAAFNPKIKKSLDINLVHSFSHTSVVCCVQFSQDGRYLATGCNQTAQIFDTKSGQKVCELAHESEAHSGDLYIRSVRFSPDGKLLATGAEDRQIRIWDIARKRIRQIFDGHQQEIYSLDFSLDGRLIVSGSGDRTTRIWDMLENTCKVFTITDVVDPSTDAGVTSVAISPRADLVAAGSLDNVIRIWDVASGTLVERLRGHGNSVYSVAFTPDGKGLVTGSLDKTLKLWDVSHLGLRAKEEGKPNVGGSPCVMDFIGHKDYVLSVSMSSDSRWVVSGSKDRCVHVWDSQTAVLQLMLQGHKNSVISLDLNSANDLLATGSGDSYARIWSLTRV